MRRELREELDVELEAVGGALLAIDDPGSVFRFEFIEVSISGEPWCLEHEEIVWRTAGELRAMPLAPSDRVFVEQALPA